MVMEVGLCILLASAGSQFPTTMSSSLNGSLFILFHLCNPVCLVVRFMKPMQSAVAAFVLAPLLVSLFFLFWGGLAIIGEHMGAGDWV